MSEASGSKADAIVARLGELLQEADMSITTQRQITNKLAEELGEEAYEFKALIKASSLGLKLADLGLGRVHIEIRRD